MIHYRNNGKSARSIEMTSFIGGMEISPQAKTSGFRGGKPDVKPQRRERSAARNICIVINNVTAALGDAAKSFKIGLFDKHGAKNREVFFFTSSSEMIPLRKSWICLAANVSSI